MAALSERERDETVRPHVETTPAPVQAARARRAPPGRRRAPGVFNQMGRPRN